MFNDGLIRELRDQIYQRDTTIVYLKSDKQMLQDRLSFHQFRQDRNEYIRYLLTAPKPKDLESYLTKVVIHPYHLALRCLSKAQLRKELELY